MNVPVSPSPEAIEISAYPSFDSLRKAHNDLLKQSRETKDTLDMADTITDFILRGKKSGALLDTEDERQSAQSLLDYWATRLYRVQEETPDASLDEFDPMLAPELPDELCPYLGLDAFNEKHSNLLFGRQKLIQQLVAHVKQNRLLLLVGPAGSGKSSLGRA